MGSQNKRKIKVGMVHHNFFKVLKVKIQIQNC